MIKQNYKKKWASTSLNLTKSVIIPRMYTLPIILYEVLEKKYKGMEISKSYSLMI